MDNQHKVLWNEGLFLTPQHLQQADRHHDFGLVMGLRALNGNAWGLTSLRIDEEALGGGEFILQAASGIMPDGLQFDLPEHDARPQSRAVAASFPASVEKLAVYLACPLSRPNALEIHPEGISEGRLTRFRQRAVKLKDESSGGNERDVFIAVPNLRVAFEGEPLEDSTYIKLCELQRTATGGFALAQTWVPPLLYLSASPWLFSLLRRAVEIISTKSNDLAASRRQRGSGLVEFSMSEAANFWLLHSCNAYIPALMHYYNQPRLHPEVLYVTLARLAGELTTFSAEGSPRDLPQYQHDNLYGTFSQLEARLRSLLDVTIASRCVNIPLEKTRESLYSGKFIDERLVTASKLYLAVMSGVAPEKVINEVPLKAKISSRDRVDKLIAMAMRGLVIKHLPAPPAEIPVQPGRQYFQLEKAGEHWEAVANSRTISMYFPPEFSELKLEFLAVKE
ncbi:type VI secretion system baseplate subunit TssK [bacterium]|nr:MAG: type VI secretion system baseplate subunit TssK [bacterium]RIK61970.1 MAG: type VI secretion system baseplate subunit TssK [Planctomycetota bacterium]